jgi:HAAS
VIDRYLEQLARQLPLLGKRRILAEVAAHLREAAARVGEDEAIARFGAPADVASGFRPAVARRAAFWAVIALGLCIGAAFVGLLVIPENALPPAPWPTDAPPFYLRWKRDAVAVLFFVGVAGFAAALATGRWIAVRLTFVAFGLVTLAVQLALAAILALEWRNAVPGSPGPLAVGLWTALEVGALAAVAALAAYATHVRVRAAA